MIKKTEGIDETKQVEKFLEMFMRMNRKERRNFSKKAKIPWKGLPKYTKEQSDQESRRIRKRTKEEDIEHRQMKVERKERKRQMRRDKRK